MTFACFQVASSCILPSIITAPEPSGIASRIFLANATSAGSGEKHRLGDGDLARMKRPGAGAAHQEGVAELRFAGVGVGKVAERAVERLDAVGRARVDHAGDRVVPEILLRARSRRAGSLGVGEHLIVGVAAADPRRLHRARGGEIGRPEAHAVHARRSGGDRLDIVDALAPFRGSRGRGSASSARGAPRAAPGTGR